MSSSRSALVVDDDAAIRMLTCRALIGIGIECDEAADGVEAGDMLETKLYDLLVTDLRMPFRHGHALASLLLAKPGPRPAIVVLTGVDDPRLAADLRARGVDELFRKPIDYRQFASRMQVLLDRRSASARDRSAPLATTRLHAQAK